MTYRKITGNHNTKMPFHCTFRQRQELLALFFNSSCKKTKLKLFLLFVSLLSPLAWNVFSVIFSVLCCRVVIQQCCIQTITLSGLKAVSILQTKLNYSELNVFKGILCMYCSRGIITLKDRFVLDMSKTKELMIYSFKIYLINVPNPNNSTAIQILN